MALLRIFSTFILVLILSSCDQRSSTPSITSSAQCSATLQICVNQCCPEKPQDDTVVDHNIFVLANNPQTKFADWVAYKVDIKNLGGPTRSRYWRRDPQLPIDETLSPADYTGAYATHRYDRGHQGPLASFSNNSNWEKTNYLSNITPQRANLNRFSWMYLEKAVRILAKNNPSAKVYVITGTLYEHSMPALPHSHLSHKVPSAYFKIIVLEKNGHSNLAAFVFDQNHPKHNDFCQDKTRMGSLTSRLTFNPLPSLTTYSETLTTEMGC